MIKLTSGMQVRIKERMGFAQLGLFFPVGTRALVKEVEDSRVFDPSLPLNPALPREVAESGAFRDGRYAFIQLFPSMLELKLADPLWDRFLETEQ